MLGDRVEQRDRLQPVARGPRAGLLDDAPAVDRVLHARDDQALAELGDAAVAELDHLREVVLRVHMHQREREWRGAERLLGQAEQHDRVLASAEQEHGTLEFRSDLTHHVDGLRLERPQMAQLQACGDAHCGAGSTCRPHSVLSVPAQRPSRPEPGWVHGAHPIDS